MSNDEWPAIPYDEWKPTKTALHLICQIVGKVRLTLSPPMNHWWHATLYVTARGLTTGPMPYGTRTFDVEIDCLDLSLHVRTSEGETDSFSLEGMTVGDFYARFMRTLDELAIHAHILAKPYGVPMTEPFATDAVHGPCDAAQVRSYFQVLARIDEVLKEFRGRFIGKASPVHLFWHSFDIATARFSGRKAPVREGADPVNAEAYSHEVSSAGFWAGDDKIAAPCFYSYTAPLPPGMQDEPLRPAAARWGMEYGSPMAILLYDDMRAAPDPRSALLEFLQSAYEAGANRAGWDRASLER